MKTLVDHLSQYASYHRDPRNIATHFVGIPLIVLAVTILLSRPGGSMLGCGFPRRCWSPPPRCGSTCVWMCASGW